MNFTRRDLAVLLLVAPLIPTFPRRASAQFVETLAVAGAKALVEGLATNLASHILPPKTYVDEEVRQKLREIGRKLDELTNMVAALPGVLTEQVRRQLEQDRRSLLDAQKPQVDAIATAVSRRRPPQLTRDERAQLNNIVVSVQTFADSLWRYGPAIYPSVTFGVALAITVHRLLGSDPATVRYWVMDQVERRFLPLTDPQQEGSFRKRAEDYASTASELGDYLNRYPRTGSLGRDNFPPLLVSGGGFGPGQPGVSVRPGPCRPMLGRVSPENLPSGDMQFSVSGEWDTFGADRTAFPDFGFEDRCVRGGNWMQPEDQAGRLRNFLNERLQEQRKSVMLAARFDACSDDVLGAAEGFKRIVGG